MEFFFIETFREFHGIYMFFVSLQRAVVDMEP